ncbi:phasin family protein [Methylobacterium aerolatum]|uniref:Phasin domain-containing protein n=1 Tax=Methylobacterium aerolatum TaxID=418708 RepID=A0ABU0HYD5_9HYPH|nr:phasin family protein [Methylobacterium aerolatum]MDQ0447349.1 hypothetical protein [Methylobacterium aerolatum]GJD34100.1 hypothetical protein FMGBMHLM_0996 [Methylobacterium aerolatum]
MTHDHLPAVSDGARREMAEGAVRKAREAYERYAEAGEQALNAAETSFAQAFEGWRQVMHATREAATQLSESQVAQTRKAREQWETAGSRLYNAFEDDAGRMMAAMREIAHRMLVASDTNVRASLDFAEELAKASDPRDMLKLQVAFLQDQSRRITDQVVDLHQTTTRLAREAVSRAETR